MSVPIDGGAASTLATGRSALLIAVDATSVYWARHGDSACQGTVVKVPVGGGILTTLASGLASPYGVAVDGTSVYLTDLVDGNILKVTPK
jgi:hypothetical protein